MIIAKIMKKFLAWHHCLKTFGVFYSFFLCDGVHPFVEPSLMTVDHRAHAYHDCCRLATLSLWSENMQTVARQLFRQPDMVHVQSMLALAFRPVVSTDTCNAVSRLLKIRHLGVCRQSDGLEEEGEVSKIALFWPPLRSLGNDSPWTGCGRCC